MSHLSWDGALCSPFSWDLAPSLAREPENTHKGLRDFRNQAIK